MDSVSQLALGAAVGVAVMGRRTALWKAAAWGAVAGTLPDLDVVIDHGDPIANMVLHRAETHSLFWLTLFSLPFAWLVARLHREPATPWPRWWLALWLALVTHPLLDFFTVYGTQLALPFSNHPYALGSVFIIDPLYTLPLLLGTGSALAGGRLRANVAGLVLSTAYLGWGVVAQQQVQEVASASLAAQGIRAERVLVTPAPFNSVLWRVLAVDGARYHEGYYSLLDRERVMRFDRFERSTPELDAALGTSAPVRTLAAFSHGFYKLSVQGQRVLLTDLRMGQEPHYIFSFAVGEQRSPPVPVLPVVQVGGRPDPSRLLPWLWRRLRGEDVAPPR
jgi:inner membrane protein